MGININEINQTNIIINAIYITYIVLYQFLLPNVHPIPLAINLISIPKLRRFLMRGQQSSLFQRHSSSTSYHSKTESLPYGRKLSHNSTSWFPTINQPRSQQSTWPSNQPEFQRLHPVFKIMTIYCCYILLCCYKLKHEHQILSIIINKWYESNIKSNIRKILHLPLENLCYFSQIEMIPCKIKYNRSQCLI